MGFDDMNLDPRVAEYMRKKQEAEQGVDNSQMIGVGVEALDKFANTNRQPTVLNNRMQDLGKAPAMIEQEQQNTNTSGLQEQAREKLRSASHDAGDAVKVAFEQRKAQLAAQVAEKQAADQAARDERKMAFDEKKLALENKFKERQLGQQADIARMTAGAKQASNEQTKAKALEPKPLTSEAALKLANFQNAMQAVDEMEKAIQGGESTFTLVGDNDFTLAQDKFAEGYGRGSSGASITKEERDAFKGRTPSWKNDTEQKKAKIRELREDIQMKIDALKNGGTQTPAVDTDSQAGGATGSWDDDGLDNLSDDELLKMHSQIRK